MGLAHYLLDNEIKQRADIHEAFSEAGVAQYRSELALENVEQLRKVVVAQREQIAELGAVTSVLVKLLTESGAIDDKVLRYRVEAELDAMAEAAKPKVAPVTGKQLRCTRCDRLVVATAIQVTPDGNVCDRCMALGL